MAMPRSFSAEIVVTILGELPRARPATSSGISLNG